MSLSDADAKLYRLYAVGKISYEDALRQAQSVVQLRRALLGFDQNARLPDRAGAEGKRKEE
jgi:Tfp pilus assembly ATPase PilU